MKSFMDKMGQRNRINPEGQLPGLKRHSPDSNPSLGGLKILGRIAILLFLTVLIAWSVSGQNIPPAPDPPRLVNDYAGVLNVQDKALLERKLVAYDDSTSTQIVIVIIPTTDDYDMVDYAVKLGRSWGVGGKEFNNGIVVLVATEDHKVFIATGYGMEGAIPDITAKQIIDNSIVPHFKKNDYYGGLNQGTDDLIRAAAGEYKAPPGYHQPDKGGGALAFFLIFIFILILFIFISSRGGGGGGDQNGGDGYNRRGRGYGLGPFLGGMFLGNMMGRGSRGGGFGGGAGGGFGGFGGGSFGGGGAGGSW